MDTLDQSVGLIRPHKLNLYINLLKLLVFDRYLNVINDKTEMGSGYCWGIISQQFISTSFYSLQG